MIYEILELLLISGFRPSKAKMLIVFQYFMNMLKAGRIITFREQGDLIGFCTYSMTDCYEECSDKNLWDFIDHNESGKGAYIEMIVSYKWDRKLRHLVEEAIAKLPCTSRVAGVVVEEPPIRTLSPGTRFLIAPTIYLSHCVGRAKAIVGTMTNIMMRIL